MAKNFVVSTPRQAKSVFKPAKSPLEIIPFNWDLDMGLRYRELLKENIHKAIEETGVQLENTWKGYSKVDTGLFKATIGTFTPRDIVKPDEAEEKARASGGSPGSLAIREWEREHSLLVGNKVSYGESQNAMPPRAGGPGIMFACEEAIIETEEFFVQKIGEAMESAEKGIKY